MIPGTRVTLVRRIVYYGDIAGTVLRIQGSKALVLWDAGITAWHRVTDLAAV